MPLPVVGLLILAALGLVGVVYWLGRRNAQLDQRVKDHARAVEAAVDAAVQSHKREVLQQDTITQLRRSQQHQDLEAERQGHAIDSLESIIVGQEQLGPEPELPGAATIRDSMNHYRRLYRERTEQMMHALARIRADSLQIDSLRLERDLVTVQRDSARAERDRALQLAAAGVELSVCRYDLVIVKPKCLSRNASFVAGAVVSSAVWLATRPKEEKPAPADDGIPLQEAPAGGIR